MSLCSRLTRLAFLTAAVFPAAISPAAAQSFRPIARLQSEVRYDNNPFLLSGGRKRQLAARSFADSLSGRFREMESAIDVIPIASLRLGVAAPGIGGRAIDLAAEAVYEANLRNAARRHLELGFAIDQSLPRSGRVRLGADWRPSYFHKNYLADAVDLDADDNIAPEERRYTRATSNELDVALKYRLRLAKPGDHRVGVSADLQVGYLDRHYDAPFAGRSRAGPDAGAALAFQVGPVWRLTLDYAFASLQGEDANEILILDETEFGVDLNGNLTTTDTSARAAVLVNHSRVEHQLEVTLAGDVGTAATVTLAYGRRLRNFGSDQPFDAVNRDRTDDLSEVTAAADLRLVSGLRLTLGARRAGQTTNRGADPGSTGDVADYTRLVAWTGLRYRF